MIKWKKKKIKKGKYSAVATASATDQKEVYNIITTFQPSHKAANKIPFSLSFAFWYAHKPHTHTLLQTKLNSSKTVFSLSFFYIYEILSFSLSLLFTTHHFFLTVLGLLSFSLSFSFLLSQMENKQSFFSALKDEVVRGLSPSRSRSKSPARTASPISGLLRRKKHNPDSSVARSASLRPLGETLTPLIEGPDPDASENGDPKRIGSGLGHWMKGQLSRAPSVSYKRSDLRLLLGVMGAPLAPVHVCSTDPLPHLSIKDTPIVSPQS